MLFEKTKKRWIITFYFKTSTVDVGECIQPQQHWSKQHSKVVTSDVVETVTPETETWLKSQDETETLL